MAPTINGKTAELISVAFANWERDCAPETMKLAKALCKAAGFDPEIAVMGWSNQPPMLGAKGTIVILDNVPFRPQWSLFTDEARTALEFMGMLE